MPKLKTHKGITSRFKLTARGKVVAGRPGRRHLLAHRRAKTMRKLRRQRALAPAQARVLRPFLS